MNVNKLTKTLLTSVHHYRRLYRELSVYKQILEAKNDFTKLCMECKSFKPINQTTTKVIMCFNKYMQYSSLAYINRK